MPDLPEESAAARFELVKKRGPARTYIRDTKHLIASRILAENRLDFQGKSLVFDAESGAFVLTESPEMFANILCETRSTTSAGEMVFRHSSAIGFVQRDFMH